MNIFSDISTGMPHLEDALRKQRIDCFGNIVSVLPWFNSDILHKLYINIFQELPEAISIHKGVNSNLSDYKVRSITCADFIHSPKVKRIDLNVFEVVPEIKNKLRKELDVDLLKKVAEFMLMYVASCPEHILTFKYKEALRVEANFILNPKSEVKRIVAHIAEQASREFMSQEKVEASIKFYLNVVRDSTAQNQLSVEFKNLERLANQDYEHLELAETGSNSFKVSMPLHVKNEILKQINQIPETPIDNQKFIANNLFAMSIGIDNGPVLKNPSPNKDVENAQNFGHLLSAFIPSTKMKDNQLLLNNRATKTNIFETVKKYIAQIRSGDYFLFYYSGKSRTENIRNKSRISIAKTNHECLETAFGAGEMQTIAEDELKYIAKEVASKGGRAIFIINAKNVNANYSELLQRNDNDFYFNEELQSFSGDYKEFLQGGEGLLWALYDHDFSLNINTSLFTDTLLQELHSGRNPSIKEINNKLNEAINNKGQIEQSNSPTPIETNFNFFGKTFDDEPFLNGIYRTDLVEKVQHKLIEFQKEITSEETISNIETVTGIWNEDWENLLKEFQLQRQIRKKGILDFATINALKLTPRLPNKWILVTGTGTKKEFEAEPRQKETAQHVAKGMMENNFGLITSGWPYVDETVGRFFVQLLQAEGLNPKDYFKIVTADNVFMGNDMKDHAKVIRLEETSFELASQSILNYADAVIIIGGSVNVTKTAEIAMQRSLPVFPIGNSGGAAEKLSKDPTYESYILNISDGEFRAYETEGSIESATKNIFTALNDISFNILEHDWLGFSETILANMVLIKKQSAYGSVGAEAPNEDTYSGIILNNDYLLTTTEAINSQADADMLQVITQGENPKIIYLDYKSFFTAREDLGYAIIAIDKTSDLGSINKLNFFSGNEIIEKENVGFIMVSNLEDGIPVTYASKIEVVENDFIHVSYQELSVESGGVIFNSNNEIIALTNGVDSNSIKPGRFVKCTRIDKILKSLKEIGLYDRVFENKSFES